MNGKSIPHSVVERLGWYVYAYVNKRNNHIDYVGKGCGQRALAHLLRLRQHRVDILAHGLRDEATAYTLECALLDVLERLTNKVRGRDARTCGRETLDDVIARYAARRITIREPSVLIRINRLYFPGIDGQRLYEITRGVWKIGEKRKGLVYALAVYRGVVREVYKIQSWRRAGTTRYHHRKKRDVKVPNRWEFVGRLAPSSVRDRYKAGSVAYLLPDGARNPIRYVSLRN